LAASSSIGVNQLVAVSGRLAKNLPEQQPALRTTGAK